MLIKNKNLRWLEAESINIIRETYAEANNPVLLYSIGKDSSVLLHLASKAFYPEPIPFPILHIDTTWKFREMYQFREKIQRKYKFKLIVYKNKEALKKNINPFNYSSDIYTDIMKTQALKHSLDKYNFDFAFGGARRDEEKSRAKERIFSARNKMHVWEPKFQRPECWDTYNLKLSNEQKMRVFPLSNWTELDIWNYIKVEKIPIVNLYYSKKRPFVIREKKIIMIDDNRLKVNRGEKVLRDFIRFRTLGCYPLTAGIYSKADSIQKIIYELLSSDKSEREGRLIDSDQDSSMEKKK